LWNKNGVQKGRGIRNLEGMSTTYLVVAIKKERKKEIKEEKSYPLFLKLIENSIFSPPLALFMKLAGKNHS